MDTFCDINSRSVFIVLWYKLVSFGVFERFYFAKKTQAMLLFLPIYTTQAGGEFGSMCFMMRDTLAALSVSGTSLFRARAINIIMWTGHGY
jgi:hypothetical protein